ncbi:hypothetical protein NQ318_014016 [Aromia moschata]|uniref:Uncharacterized protein n=1 Tax=Aromia moschata TaxID=1265417 RepID=A0AAV8YYK7_9CUCU|nr:hypothetical protein NQ318_014016 [Aromia moschata]
MSCAWVKIEKLEPINLEDVISEEITIRNQVKEEKQCKNTAGMSTESVTTTAAIVVEDRLGKIGGVSNQNLDDDALMAKMLQIQFDKECDKELKCPQIYGNYQKAPLNFGFQSDGKEEEIISMQQEKVLDKLDLPDRAIIPIHYCGNKKLSDTQIITKHDIIMSGKKNANTDGQDDFISNLSIKAFNE